MLDPRSTVRRGLLAAALVLGTGAVAASPAAATITQTAITQPASPFIYAFNEDVTPAPTVTISGTTNSTAPGTDAVDINCYYSTAGSGNFQTIASGVTTAADGTFTWTGSVDQRGYTCQLRAVPAGYGTSFPQSPFGAVAAELDATKTLFVNGSTTTAEDFYDTATGTQAYDDYDSVGSCGLDYSYPINGTDYTHSGTWDCAGALFSNDGSNQRTEVLVDGKNAYDSYAADHAYTDGALGQTSGQAAGFPALSSTYARDLATGNVTITEKEDLVSCADATYPASETKCGGTAGTSIGTWQDDGVTFARAISQTQGGQVVTMADTYTSTDGHSHALDLEYENETDLDGDQTWKGSGSAGYAAYATGDNLPLSSRSEDSIGLRDGYEPDATPEDGPGALIYYTQPSSAVFRDSSGTLLLGYRPTVPAGGSVTIVHTYVTARDQATLGSLTNGVIDQTAKPTVAITSPAPNSLTGQDTVQVGGTASAHDGLALKVNGQAVGVNPDGTWATTLALHPGANPVSATASDGSGNVATAAETVVYLPAASPTSPNPVKSFCIVPNVRKLSLSRAESALKAANCKVGHVSRVRVKGFKKGTVENASYGAYVVLKAGTSVGLNEVIGAPLKKKTTKKKSSKKSTKHTSRKK